MIEERAKHDFPIPGSPSSYVNLYPEQIFEIRSNISLRLPISSFIGAGIYLIVTLSVKLINFPFCRGPNILHTCGSYLSAPCELITLISSYNNILNMFEDPMLISNSTAALALSYASHIKAPLKICL